MTSLLSTRTALWLSLPLGAAVSLAFAPFNWWPLAILAVMILAFGVLLARGAMFAYDASLPVTNPFKGHNRIQEIAFWVAAVTCGYGLYLVMTY